MSIFLRVIETPFSTPWGIEILFSIPHRTAGWDVSAVGGHAASLAASDWEADYGRRSLIESVNAGLKTHFATMSRASIRVMGRAKITFAFGILCAVMNMRLIRERYGDLLELNGTVEPLPSKGRKPFRSRYKSIANPRAGRGRAPTAPLPATMVAPPVARTHE